MRGKSRLGSKNAFASATDPRRLRRGATIAPTDDWPDIRRLQPYRLLEIEDAKRVLKEQLRETFIARGVGPHRLFDVFKKTADGRLSRAEFTRMLRNFGASVNAAHIRDWFHFLDHDGFGIKMNDFVAWFNKEDSLAVGTMTTSRRPVLSRAASKKVA